MPKDGQVVNALHEQQIVRCQPAVSTAVSAAAAVAKTTVTIHAAAVHRLLTTDAVGGQAAAATTRPARRRHGRSHKIVGLTNRVNQPLVLRIQHDGPTLQLPNVLGDGDEDGVLVGTEGNVALLQHVPQLLDLLTDLVGALLLAEVALVAPALALRHFRKFGGGLFLGRLVVVHVVVAVAIVVVMVVAVSGVGSASTAQGNDRRATATGAAERGIFASFLLGGWRYRGDE